MFSRKEIMLGIVIAFAGIMLAWTLRLEAHPDGSKPYWYPSSYIYGFVQGCWQNLAQSDEFREFWPDETKMVCGCVLDAIRHSMPWKEAESKDPIFQAKFHDIASGTLPVCTLEMQTIKKEASQ